MSDVEIKQMPLFKKAYKKLHKRQKTKVNDAIKEVVENPEIGQEKKGDLKGVFVYKFKVDQQEFLLAYQWDPKLRLLLALGVHGNFYRDLKRGH